jgi:hypothetical protein
MSPVDLFSVTKKMWKSMTELPKEWIQSKTNNGKRKKEAS